MKPVFQSIISNVDGNCHAACIASLLEIPLDIIPDFFKGNPYLKRTLWLKSIGIQEVYGRVGDYPPPNGYGILSVKSELFPNATHSVVWQGDGEGYGQIVHNPNPHDQRGIKIPNKDWIGFYVYAPLDPATLIF